MYRVVATKQFAKCIRDLTKKGKKGKDAMLKARAAQAEAAENGEITVVPRTKHGETRLENAEKYDLGDGYRLVVQLVVPATRQRAFLFVGDHSDEEIWLENHKNYRWVMRDGDSTLEFVQVSEPTESLTRAPVWDTESPESFLELPLLGDITEQQWSSTGFSTIAVAYLKGVTKGKWQEDPTGVLNHVESLAGMELAVLALDLLELAHKREWSELLKRLEVAASQSHIVEPGRAAVAMTAPVNSEQFVTWEDLSSLPPDGDWADWMLFLHPEQKDSLRRSSMDLLACVASPGVEKPAS